jgi:hypothetical protein
VLSAVAVAQEVLAIAVPGDFGGVLCHLLFRIKKDHCRQIRPVERFVPIQGAGEVESLLDSALSVSFPFLQETSRLEKRAALFSTERS